MDYQPSEEYIEKVRHDPCPAVKRNGEVCGSTRILVSGYCFAHDPESAAWRVMGGRATRKEKRAAKRIKETGMGHVWEMLEEELKALSSGEGEADVARAMTRVAESILKMVKAASEDEKRDEPFKWPM